MEHVGWLDCALVVAEKDACNHAQPGCISQGCLQNICKVEISVGGSVELWHTDNLENAELNPKTPSG
jgi:hypothetical protein